ncbi:DNA/RNA helicase domain-containing protein [Kitasatospora indigofera]|uniref:DNA/RNA helicase domain-containing protein n=1 Tax=Kitasatospora indigofera TaxID=67307 RepID=UPI00365F1368
MTATVPPTASAGPSRTAPYLWAGTVGELADLVADPAFMSACVRRQEAVQRKKVSASERRSWANSWPPLARALKRAGLDGLRVYLEYATPGGSARFDALLLGSTSEGRLAAVVVELKQWQGAEVLSPTWVRRDDGVEVPHPVVQAAGYRAFLRNWFNAGRSDLDARAVVCLHDAPHARAEELRRDHQGGHGAGIPVIGRDDLAPGQVPRALAQRFLAADLATPTDGQVVEFEQARWTPSARLMQEAGRLLTSAASPITLIADQQKALLGIQHRVAQASEHDRSTVIAVTGRPGSGKTLIATRLLGHFLRNRPDLKPHYISPSGTLVAQMREAVAEVPGAGDLVLLPQAALTHAVRGSRLAIIDEAQRLPQGSTRNGVLEQLLARTRGLVLVLLFDERQVISPKEGITLAEAQELARRHGADFHHHLLSGSFRNGSAAYDQWVDDLLYGTPRPWTGTDYDIAPAENPQRLQNWIDHHTAAGHRARTAAGFCWRWNRDSPKLLNEVEIHWDDEKGHEQTWRAPWNADRHLADSQAPHRNFWATHPGGHQQVGCIYTAQGLEYPYGGVIIGPDLVHDGNRWTAHPERSHDRDDFKRLTPEQYLPLALNIYRVLLTRGTQATRLYSTDKTTQRFLTALATPTST